MNENHIKQDSIKAWLLAARPKTLTGAAVPVMIGLALAWIDTRDYITDVFSWTAALLCMAFALVMQIDANFINDFFDYTRGNDDTETRLGPLRACTQGWVKIESMKKAIALTTCLACVIGLPLILYGGMEMIVVGIICVLFCFLYTTHLSYVGMGDVLVFVFFGIVPVCITYYIQLHTCTWQVFIASIACGAVIDGLLIINNYRDRDNDQRDGKKTLVVEIGAEATEWLYLSLGIGAVLAGITFWINGHILAFIMPFSYLLLHVLTWQKMRRINHGRELNECLSETARNMFIYGLSVSIGLLLI
ncbi:1,4-dihydroxy-2-naphthoate prenyltransferase [Prevotellaceae bacterium MN60]|jgi:1,4-dihydroxy-2-naphthoate octaprenyltransferase|nr:1,4-dihydroxy-2-naphthoate prenyltransferase [Prevotellaceae bacterium MN60]